MNITCHDEPHVQLKNPQPSQDSFGPSRDLNEAGIHKHKAKENNNSDH